jgi:hypothetical protein
LKNNILSNALTIVGKKKEKRKLTNIKRVLAGLTLRRTLQVSVSLQTHVNVEIWLRTT